MGDQESGNQSNHNGYTNEAFHNDEVLSKREINEKSRIKSSGKVAPSSNNSSSEIEKEQWGGGFEFLMACIATSVGLGNIWRFPFTALENGGGAFLIPYIIILIFVGKPFYYLEAILGQFTSRSCGKTWSMTPAMRGLGYGQVLTAFCVVTYYCSLMALTIYYLVSSFQSVLPWSYCRENWNNCLDASLNISNGTILQNTTLSSSAELFFRKIVLNELDSIEDGIGLPSWSLSLCLLFSWLCLFAIMCRGVKSSGKAVYFLAIFPYIVMIILLIRAVTLEGAVNGILFFFEPKWEALLKPNVWYAAITQCFFSLSVCFGPIITYSSHSRFNHQLSRDVIIVTTLDTFTSLMAGCTIFGILGNLAHEMGTDDISKVVLGGTGLAFISYPDALSRFAVVPQFFSALFFFMMFVLGAGSAMALYNVVVAVLCDHFPHVKRWKTALIMAVIGFLFGLIYITPGGQWFVTLIDYYGGNCVAIIVGVAEVITIFWIYGLVNFLNDTEFMLGIRPGLYWKICWFVITPVLMIIILFYTFVTYVPPTYNGINFPDYAYGIGWFIFAIGIIQIIGFIVREVVRQKQLSLVDAIKAAFRPSEKNWGPYNRETRAKWKEFILEKKKIQPNSNFKELLQR